MKQISTARAYSCLYAMFTATLLAFSIDAGASNLNWRQCAGSAIGGPIGPPPVHLSGPPQVDGEIDNDPGWTLAWRYVFNNGTPVHDVAVQSVADANSLWLSFDVNNDQALNTNDIVVIAFEGNDGKKRLLKFNPLINGAVNNPVGVNYWETTSGGTFSGGGAAPPFVIEAKAASSGATPNVRWILEMKLPLSGLHVSSAANFGMYMNVLVKQGTGSGPTGLVNEYAWPVPSSDAQWLLGDPTSVPDPSVWGTATVAGPACAGVSVSSIGTLNSPSSKIIIGQQNTFRAVVNNSSVDAAGNPATAKQVIAKFSYSTFGISTTWTPIPADAAAPNPAGPRDISGGVQLNFDTKWTVPSSNPEFPDGGKACVRVDLDTTAPGGGPNDWTTVFNRSFWSNFHFATASSVQSRPVIDTRGWLSPASGPDQKVELFMGSKIDVIDRELARAGTQDRASSPNLGAAAGLQLTLAGEARGDPWRRLAELTPFPVERNQSFEDYLRELLANAVQVSQLVQMTHACRRSGKFISIEGENLEVCERMGSFGYAIRHAGLGRTHWTIGVQGQNDPKQLSLSIPAGTRLPLDVGFTGETKVDRFCATLGGKQAASGMLILAVVGFAAYVPRRRKDARQESGR